jgi:hypothetical protein
MFVSCSHKRELIYASSSPDGTANVQVSSYSSFPLQPSEVVELIITNTYHKRVVRTWTAKSLDMFPCFVAAAWSSDSRKVIVLFRNCYTRAEIAGFDARSFQPLEGNELKPLLAAHIRAVYKLSEGVLDPLEWAADSVEAKDLFVTKHY